MAAVVALGNLTVQHRERHRGGIADIPEIALEAIVEHQDAEAWGFVHAQPCSRHAAPSRTLLGREEPRQRINIPVVTLFICRHFAIEFRNAGIDVAKRLPIP